MNKWEKEVQRSLLASEEAAIKELEKQYKKALKDINEKVKLFDSDIKQLQEAINADGLDDAAREVLISQQRSKVYQKQYQEALKGQISGILDNLHGTEYATIDKYLKECYTNGYVGTMYDIAKQGVPVIMPIDQAAVVKAVLTDSKVSKGLYNALGVNVNKLKKSITQEVSRGIATGLSYSDIARNISNAAKAPLSRAKTIARTEGHRIQVTSTADAQKAAKAKGADVVKQWDAALDSKTRPSHRRVDGEIRELDEKFSNGLMQPGDSAGGAAEVVNCRCALLTRARWALDEDELETLRERARYFGLMEEDSKAYGHYKAKNTFSGYKEKYLNAVENLEKGVKIDIDELTPCLRRLSDNKIISTSVYDVSPTKKEFKDWEFDWTIPVKNGFTVRALKVDGDDRIQGMVALKPDKRNYAVQIDIVEAAPHNSPHNKRFVKKEYSGIGGHLFAEAVRESFKLGFDGYVYFTAKSDLIEHYKKELGAVLMNPRLRIMAIEEGSAKKLYDRYYQSE